MSDELQMPAPLYDSATQQALNGDLETDLDNDNILAQHATQNSKHEDVYARQALIRSQQELAAANARVSQLDQTVGSLTSDHQYLRGQLDTLTTSSTAQQQEAQRAAHMAQFQLNADEQASYGDAVPVVNKLLGAALYEQEQRLRKEFDQQLAQRTQSALDPVLAEVNTLKQGSELQARQAQASFDDNVKAQLKARGTTLEALVADPAFQEQAGKMIPGAGRTFFQQFKDNATQGNVSGMMEFVDYALSQNPNHQGSPDALPPTGGNRPPQHSGGNKNLEARNKLQAELERLEGLNAVGNYGEFGGNRSKFMEARNAVLVKIEQTPLT